MDESQNQSSQAAPESGPETTGSSKILEMARGSFEKIQRIIKPGRGRPRADGTPKKSDTVEFVPADKAAAGPEPASPAAPVSGASVTAAIGPKIIRSCVSGLVKGFWAVPESIIRLLASKRGISDREMDSKIARCSPLAEEIDALSEVLPVIAKKYGWDLENSPEGIAIIILSLQTARYGALGIEVVKTPVPQPMVGQPANVTELKQNE